MDHGGQPDAGTNPAIGIDGTNLQISGTGLAPDTWVIPISQDFQVAMEFELTGSFAMWVLTQPSVNFTVTYTFGGRGNPDGPLLSVGPVPVTSASPNPPAVPPNMPPFIIGATDTAAQVAAGSLPVGLYELTAVVTFGGNPPMSAFTDLPVVEVFQD